MSNSRAIFSEQPIGHSALGLQPEHIHREAAHPLRPRNLRKKSPGRFFVHSFDQHNLNDFLVSYVLIVHKIEVDYDRF